VEKKLAFLDLLDLAYFLQFLQILPQLEYFFQNSTSAHHSHTTCHLYAKFDNFRLLLSEGVKAKVKTAIKFDCFVCQYRHHFVF